MNSMTGDKYMLKQAVLGNPVGTIGYVFNEYIDFDNKNEKGIQVIFPNGEYDGFSVKEQELFLEFQGVDWRYVTYEFRNVIQVSIDFDKGYWKW